MSSEVSGSRDLSPGQPARLRFGTVQAERLVQARKEPFDDGGGGYQLVLTRAPEGRVRLMTVPMQLKVLACSAGRFCWRNRRLERGAEGLEVRCIDGRLEGVQVGVTGHGGAPDGLHVG